MEFTRSGQKLALAPTDKPKLIVVIDTEEEFDWSQPFSREAISVSNIDHLDRLQETFDRFRLQPIYVVDYPIASQPRAWRPLRALAEAGRASIGAHLHPWVTPPYDEELSARNSYGCNLDRDLERAKISALTEQIEESFGFRPRAFKAGRFGVGPNTFSALGELGYQVDLSPAPPLDCSGDGGPDFTCMDCQPFRDQATGLLVLPNSGGFYGWLPGPRARAHRWISTGWRSKLYLHSFFWRSGAARRCWVSPESFSAAEMIRLTRSLHRTGLRTFVLSLHSSVMLPGATAFARDEAGVMKMIDRLREFLEFFCDELGGEPWTVGAALACWTDRSVMPASEGVRSYADQVT